MIARAPTHFLVPNDQLGVTAVLQVEPLVRFDDASYHAAIWPMQRQVTLLALRGLRAKYAHLCEEPVR